MDAFVALQNDGVTTVWLIDDVHLLENGEWQAIITSLMSTVQLPSQLVVSGWVEPEVRLAKRRAEGGVHDLTEADLRLGATEVSALAASQGADLGPEIVQRIIATTGGWPRGCVEMVDRLLNAQPALAMDIIEQSADKAGQQLVRSSGLDTDTLDALTAMSTLDVVNEDIYRHLTGRTGLASTVAQARSAGLLLRPIDREHSQFQMHPILRRGLRLRLQQKWQSTDTRTLHRRATEWYRSSGDITRAVQHALEAGSPELAADAIGAQPNVAPDHYDFSALELLSGIDLDDYVPHLLNVGFEALQRSEVRTAERVIERLSNMRWDGPLPQGYQSLDMAVLDLASHLPAKPWDVARRVPGIVSQSEEGAGGPRELVMRYYAAHMTYYAGDLPSAASQLATIRIGHLALGRADPLDQIATVLSFCLSAVIAHDTGEADAAASLHEQARTLLDTYELPTQPPRTSQVLDLAAALCARETARDPADMLRSISVSAPNQESRLHALIELAALLDRRNEVGAAMTVLHEAEQLCDGDEPVLFARRLVRLRVAIDPAEILRQTFVPITNGERAVFKLLPQDLTQAEIGGVLDLSVNTIKSHLRSLYRKIGVSTRDEALDFGRRTGLLATATPWEEPLDAL
ncbi:LuxR C-terminal-related transcriptional regulator [Ilumatobacter sp.]|uniref:helix-turn-helix transcriptional regulator n=1 Tax=Ilumatobacter sp. TaxID=1967498 RepID=UPI003AF903DF